MRPATWLVLAGLGGAVIACRSSGSGAKTPALASTHRTTTNEAANGSREIDASLRLEWQKRGITPAKPVDDGRFLRRVYLDIVGHIPSIDELSAYLADAAPDRRSKAVEALLASPGYADHWARYWDDVLLGDKVDKNIVDREEFDRWLRASFSSNTGWDEVVTLLVTAQGVNRVRPGDADPTQKSAKTGEGSAMVGGVAEMAAPAPTMLGPNAADAEGTTSHGRVNGAVNWFLKYRDDPQDLAGMLSATFLGVKIQCAQCHDHKTEKWKQQDFQRFAACLTTVKGVPIDPERDGGPKRFELFEVRKPFVRAAKRAELEAIAAASPSTLDGTDLSKAESRREALAEWMRAPQNPWFAKAIVNRMWGYFMGRGFVEPIDDFRPTNPPLVPELLDKMAADFVAHRFDLKYLIRSITSSEAYQLASQPSGAPSGQLDLWSRYPLKPLGPDDLLDSIAVATELETLLAGKNAGEFGTAKSQLRKQFSFVFDIDEESHAASYDGTIPQALLLMNGRPLSRATNTVRQGALLKVLAMPQPDAEKIEALYLRAVARRPTAEELRLLVPLVDVRAIQRQEAFEDIFWSLLNSSEFIFNH